MIFIEDRYAEPVWYEWEGRATRSARRTPRLLGPSLRASRKLGRRGDRYRKEGPLYGGGEAQQPRRDPPGLFTNASHCIRTLAA